MKQRKQMRIETGSVQFGDDWPAVVIRGDNALWYAHLLRTFLDNPGRLNEDFITKNSIEGLIELLSSCSDSFKDEHRQFLKDYTETVKEGDDESCGDNDV